MKIPTLLGLTVILTGLLLGLMFQLYRQELNNKAEVNYAPIDIRYSNITDRSVTITWQSDTKAIGVVAWGDSQNLGDSQKDDRDDTSQTGRLTHYVTIKNLNAEKTYYFKVRNGLYFYPKQPIVFKTAKKTDYSPTSPLIGSVLDVNNSPLTEGLVYLNIPGAAPLSGFVTKSGSYVIPLTDAKTVDLMSNFNLTKNIPATLTVSEQGLQSIIQLQIPRDGPVPTVSLGQNLTLTTP